MEVHVVELLVVQLALEDFFDELIDVAHFPIDVLLEHPESLNLMEYFKSRASTQHIDCLVL